VRHALDGQAEFPRQQLPRAASGDEGVPLEEGPMVTDKVDNRGLLLVMGNEGDHKRLLMGWYQASISYSSLRRACLRCRVGTPAALPPPSWPLAYNLTCGF
jgi:hypothetical protein